MLQKAILLFSLFILLVSSQNPGIRVEVTEQGLTDIKDVAQTLISTFISQNEPFHIPDQSLDGYITATNLYAGAISFQTFSFDVVANQGIQINLYGLNFELNYTLGYNIDITSGSFNGMASVSDTNFTGYLTLKKTSDGHVSATLENAALSIGTVDPGFPSDWIEILVEYAQRIIRVVLDYIVPSQITPLVNSQLNTYLSSLSMTAFLDPKQTILIDYSLVDDPQITDTQIGVDLKGDIHWTQVPSCGLNYGPLTTSQTDDVRVYVSGTVVDCLINALQQSGTGTEIANSLIAQYLKLDNRISLDLNFTLGSNVEVSPQGITALITFDVDFYRNFYNPELYIELQVNISAALTVNLDTTQGVKVVAQISTLTTALDVDDVAADMPDFYQQQIQNTDFTQLASQANLFISSTVIPAVNPLLAGGFAIPPQYLTYISSPVLNFGNEMIFVAADIVNPSQRATKPSTSQL